MGAIAGQVPPGSNLIVESEDQRESHGAVADCDGRILVERLFIGTYRVFAAGEPSGAVRVQVRPNTTSMATARAHGAGCRIAVLPKLICFDDLQSGRLQEVLPSCELGYAEVQAVHRQPSLVFGSLTLWFIIELAMKVVGLQRQVDALIRLQKLL